MPPTKSPEDVLRALSDTMRTMGIDPPTDVTMKFIEDAVLCGVDDPYSLVQDPREVEYVVRQAKKRHGEKEPPQRSPPQQNPPLSPHLIEKEMHKAILKAIACSVQENLIGEQLFSMMKNQSKEIVIVVLNGVKAAEACGHDDFREIRRAIIRFRVGYAKMQTFKKENPGVTPPASMMSTIFPSPSEEGSVRVATVPRKFLDSEVIKTTHASILFTLGFPGKPVENDLHFVITKQHIPPDKTVVVSGKETQAMKSAKNDLKTTINV